MFIKEFSFANIASEEKFLNDIKMTCYNTVYPFKIISQKNISKLEFGPITVLHGGNGSGKTTILNVIAEKLAIKRFSAYNRSNFFEDYLKFCDYLEMDDITANSRIITSDDIFDYMIDMRYLNDGIHRNRDKLLQEYSNIRDSEYRFRSLSDYEELKKRNEVVKSTKSKYINSNLKSNINQKSNGENAYMYFTENIGERGLYLLDEPENSLSPKNQLKLAQYIEESVRFFGCQFIISTHSPFMLAMKEAKIYDLDKIPVTECNWKELDNIRVYVEFFSKNFD